MIPIDTAKSLLRKRVIISSQNGALYEGTLSHINIKKKKLVLTNMVIRGKHYGNIASKRDRTRWFDLNTFSVHSTDPDDMEIKI